MSDVLRESPSGVTTAADIESQAADWLERRGSGTWSEKDQAALERWLAVSPSHRLAFLRLDAAWRYADRLAALKPAGIGKIAAATKRRIRPVFVRAASVLAAVALLGGAAATYFFSSSAKMYSTTFGGHEKIILTDGSQIELNTNTVLRAAISGDRRKVWLDKGEAFFQIAHDLKRPFVVMADNRRVTVLGTKFLVRRDPGRLEVAVVEGRVRLDTANGRAQLQSVLLTPGEAAITTANSLSVARKTAEDLAGQLSWRRGVLVFDNTTLAAAAMEFNRYNREKIIIADPAVARLTIGGTFPLNNVELFARVTRDVLGLRVENRVDEEVISR